MDMIMHKHPGMNSQVIIEGSCSQALIQKSKIVGSGQNRIAIMTAHNNVLRLIGNKKAWPPWYGFLLVDGDRGRSRTVLRVNLSAWLLEQPSQA